MRWPARRRSLCSPPCSAACLRTPACDAAPNACRRGMHSAPGGWRRQPQPAAGALHYLHDLRHRCCLAGLWDRLRCRVHSIRRGQRPRPAERSRRRRCRRCSGCRHRRRRREISGQAGQRGREGQEGRQGRDEGCRVLRQLLQAREARHEAGRHAHQRRTPALLPGRQRAVQAHWRERRQAVPLARRQRLGDACRRPGRRAGGAGRSPAAPAPRPLVAPLRHRRRGRLAPPHAPAAPRRLCCIQLGVWLQLVRRRGLAPVSRTHVVQEGSYVVQLIIVEAVC